ncbi:MAG: glycosyltransferase family protein [Gemmatimonadetes bacterium]|nr:glycosyltransferase family protein [Gemmatimonadota bacterium]
MATIDAIVCARIGSSRLPAKVLLPIVGRPVLQVVLERLRRSERIGRVVVATSAEPEDTPIVDLCVKLAVPTFRGSALDVLDRVYRCAVHFEMVHVAYFGADNPLIDPSLCDEIIGVYLEDLGEWDYVTNNLPPTFPDGVEVEVLSLAALEIAWREAEGPPYREHLLTYLWDNPQRFRIRNVAQATDMNWERWTLDFEEDYELVRRVFEALHPKKPNFGMWDVVAYLDKNPQLRSLNAMHRGAYPWRLSDT